MYILEQKNNKTINELYFSKSLALNVGIFFLFCFSFLHFFPLFFSYTKWKKKSFQASDEEGEKMDLEYFYVYSWISEVF